MDYKMRTLTILLLIFFQTFLVAQTTFFNALGGTNAEFGTSSIQSSTGDFFIVGSTQSLGSGSSDIYIVKMDQNSNVIWKKTYGSSLYEAASFSVESSDSGVVVAGYRGSGPGFYDFLLLKVDLNGNLLWNKTYGIAGGDELCSSVEITNDNGYILTGQTNSMGAGYSDIYIVKTDSVGNLLQSKVIGEVSSDVGYCIKKTTNNGYIICGTTFSFVNSSEGFLMKLDSALNITWSRRIGGMYSDQLYSIEQTSDGGFIMVGQTLSFGIGQNEVMLVKTDFWGNITWIKFYGGIKQDYGYCVHETNDNGYIVSGSTLSFISGGENIYYFKTDWNGNLLWSKVLHGVGSDQALDIKQNSLGGYYITGKTDSYGSGNNDIVFIKTDGLGNFQCLSGNAPTAVNSATISSYAITFTSATGATTSTPLMTSNDGGYQMDVCSQIGINDVEVKNTIQLYPNPNSGNFTISSKNNILKVEIFNSAGQCIFSKEQVNNNIIDIKVGDQFVSSGIYLCKILSNDNNYIIKHFNIVK